MTPDARLAGLFPAPRPPFFKDVAKSIDHKFFGQEKTNIEENVLKHKTSNKLNLIVCWKKTKRLALDVCYSEEGQRFVTGRTLNLSEPGRTKGSRSGCYVTSFGKAHSIPKNGRTGRLLGLADKIPGHGPELGRAAGTSRNFEALGRKG